MQFIEINFIILKINKDDILQHNLKKKTCWITHWCDMIYHSVTTDHSVTYDDVRKILNRPFITTNKSTIAIHVIVLEAKRVPYIFFVFH